MILTCDDPIELNAQKFNAHLARPEGDGPFPALVIIHEILGLNANIKRVADDYANQGYVALALDLFSHRSSFLPVCMVRFFFDQLFDPFENSTIGDLKAALSYLEQQPYVDAHRFGAVGFCMGGGYAISWACTDNRLRAISAYYGSNPSPLEAVKRSCPVVGSYGEKDRFGFATHGKRLKEALDLYGVPHDIKIYPNADHAFANRENNTIHSFHPEYAYNAFRRTLEFFAEHIGGPAGK